MPFSRPIRSGTNCPSTTSDGRCGRIGLALVECVGLQHCRQNLAAFPAQHQQGGATVPHSVMIRILVVLENAGICVFPAPGTFIFKIQPWLETIDPGHGFLTIQAGISRIICFGLNQAIDNQNLSLFVRLKHKTFGNVRLSEK